MLRKQRTFASYRADSVRALKSGDLDRANAIIKQGLAAARQANNDQYIQLFENQLRVFKKIPREALKKKSTTAPAGRCSFCGRTSGGTTRLVAGALAFICNHCLGNGRTPQRRSERSTGHRQANVRRGGTEVRTVACSFCGRTFDKRLLKLVNRKAAICDECFTMAEGMTGPSDGDR